MSDIRKVLKLFLAPIIFLALLSFSFPASAEILFGEDYFEALHTHLSQAEKSITVAMYFIIINPEDEIYPINTLVEDLITARKRGVEVTVLLEDSHMRASRLAYERLREGGASVYFDMPERLLHVKGVVIDDRYVFLGSANWSKAALQNNYEASVFQDSPADALVLKQYIDNIAFQKKDMFIPETSGVSIQPGFLLSAHGGRRLLKNQAYKQFDLYLLLCKIQQDTNTAEITIDYDSLAKAMSYKAPKDLGRYRNDNHYYYERIHRSLKRIKGYGLISYNKGIVKLNTEDLNIPDKPLIVIPLEYWSYNYSDTLSMRAKYMYLICLYEARLSTRYPSWFRSQKDMAALYGISDTTISLGLMELEEKGVIEVTRDKKTPPDFSNRKANIYRLLPLKPKSKK